MKKYLTLTTILVIATAILTGCKKDKSNAVAKTKTQLLTEKTWKQVKFEQRATLSDPWTDVTGTIQSCERDNITSFATTGTFTETEGATKCSPSNPDIASSGSWSFESNETILRINDRGFITDATIETLDANTLIFSFTYAGAPFSWRSTMQH